MTNWQPIDTAPFDREVLVTGLSGYVPPHDRFFVNAYRADGYKQGAWLDATGTRLSDTGWEPTHWMELGELSQLPQSLNWRSLRDKHGNDSLQAVSRWRDLYFPGRERRWQFIKVLRDNRIWWVADHDPILMQLAPRVWQHDLFESAEMAMSCAERHEQELLKSSPKLADQQTGDA